MSITDEPIEWKQCPRCGQWFPADYYVDHAWHEKP